MPLANMMNDSVELLKSDGTRRTGLKASVQRTTVFMDFDDILVEPSDLIIRRMSNGAEETYRVIDPGFHEKFHRIEAHYQMEVQKLGLPEAKSAQQNITFNISGNNARVNQNSIDHSTNVVQIDSRAIQYIESLRQELERSTLVATEKAAAHEIIDEVDGAFRNGNPKKSVVTALLKALPHVEKIAAIAAAIIGLM